jgi:hypothetical protein
VIPVLVPGQVVGLEGSAGLGMTRLGLSLLAAPSRVGMVVALDVRGWLSPPAAMEAGVVPGRLVIVRCSDRRLWPQVTAASLEGVAGVYAEVPPGVSEAQLRRLAALNRARKAALILHAIRESLPAGITHWQVRARGVDWEGPDRGHGRLLGRRLTAEVSGKSIPGREVSMEESYGHHLPAYLAQRADLTLPA